jgi:hypothetical protein
MSQNFIIYQKILNINFLKRAQKVIQYFKKREVVFEFILFYFFA